MYGLLAAAVISLAFVVTLRPDSAGAYAFLSVWLAAPYASLALLLRILWRRGKPLLPWCVTAVLVAGVGISLLTDAIVVHPDAQSAIGVVVTPILQAIAFLLATPFVWWAARRMGQ